MVYVLFYPARLVLHYTGIYFRRNVQRQFYLPRSCTYNVSAWLVSQIGMPGLGLLLLITALLFFVYLSSETINMIRKALHPNFKRKKKDTATATDNENNDTSIKPKREEKKEYSNPQPAVVDFELEQPMKVEVGSKEEEVSNTPSLLRKNRRVSLKRPMPTEANEEEEDNDEPDLPYPMIHQKRMQNIKVLPCSLIIRASIWKTISFPTLDLLNQYEDNGPKYRHGRTECQQGSHYQSIAQFWH